MNKILFYLLMLSLLVTMPILAACSNKGDIAELLSMGAELQRLGLWEEAIAEYNEALEMDPEISSAYYAQGVCYYELGSYQAAIEDLDESIRLSLEFAKS